MHDRNDIRGRLTLRLTDPQGRTVLERCQDNRIVKGGRMMVAQMFGGVASGVAPAPVTHVGVGTGADPVTDDDAALKAQRGDRKKLDAVDPATTYSEFTETSGADTVKRVRARLTAVLDFAEGNDSTVPLREAAIFTAPAGGTMYNRVVFEPVTKTNTFKLTLLWDIVF